jgi:hypothetical protein
MHGFQYGNRRKIGHPVFIGFMLLTGAASKFDGPKNSEDKNDGRGDGSENSHT